MLQTVALADMLAAREARVMRQQQLLNKYQKPLVCFTMNIAGPVKNSPLIKRGFDEGCRLLRDQFMAAKADVIYMESHGGAAGNEAFYVVDMPALETKKITTLIEDSCQLGRLFDMDVLRPNGEKVEREELGLEPRRCLICGGFVRACARSRTHTVAELQAKTNEILRQALADADAKAAAQQAVRALLYEVCTTPKPGLVDRANNGSHKDMDIFTFMGSASALWPYFERCCKIGIETAAKPAPETFTALREAGRLAEGEMLEATGGVNTHKGAVFSMGLCCAALGRLPREAWRHPSRVLDECAAMARGLTERDFAGLTAQNARTMGQKLYLQYGITGVRGQVENGFPAVREAGLPVLERGIAEGRSLNDAGCAALLAIMAASVDTNMIARGGREAQQNTALGAAMLLQKEPYPSRQTLEHLDSEFIRQNLSPGGSADLLAICYLLHFLKEGS